MFNIRRVDLNLLPVFEAVYEEQSLSRAAVRLAMTQSAVSHAVTRLRTLFKDELFVRHARGVLPTPTADSTGPVGATLIAVARGGHPVLLRPASPKILGEGKFVALRPRFEGEHPVPGIRELQQQNLEMALEVSEILEIFMVASQSDLFG